MSSPRDWISKLEPSESVLRSWLAEATELVLEHVRTLPDQPARNVDGAVEESRALAEPIPEDGTDAIPLLRTLVREHAPRSFNTAGPGYVAYVPGGGIFPAAIADLVADVTNRFVGVYAAAPLLARLEVNVLRWFLDEMGYPAEAKGILTSGGSVANLFAIVAARQKKLGEYFQDGTLYASDQVHHSVEKSARIAGFPAERIRILPSTADYKLDPEALREAVRLDRSRGLRPAVAVANAGTIHTGAVDDLSGLAAVSREEALWLHVDGAYGGFFQMTERGRARLRGIELADSITVDPHKGLFLPYGTGCLLVRDGEALRAPFRSEGVYLPTMQDDPQAQDFCEYSPELSRDYRGLRVWLPFKIFGARAFREALDEKLDLALLAARELRETPGIRMVADPELSILAFRPARDGDGEDTETRALLDRINARRRVMLSGTILRGRFVIRICVLHFRTHRDRMEEGLRIIREEAAP